MTFELSKNFHGVGIGPLSKILAVKIFALQFMPLIFKPIAGVEKIFLIKSVLLSFARLFSKNSLEVKEEKNLI